jgi:hypothetical protein
MVLSGNLLILLQRQEMMGQDDSLPRGVPTRVDPSAHESFVNESL